MDDLSLPNYLKGFRFVLKIAGITNMRQEVKLEDDEAFERLKTEFHRIISDAQATHAAGKRLPESFRVEVVIHPLRP